MQTLCRALFCAPDLFGQRRVVDTLRARDSCKLLFGIQVSSTPPFSNSAPHAFERSRRTTWTKLIPYGLADLLHTDESTLVIDFFTVFPEQYPLPINLSGTFLRIALRSAL